VLLIQGDDDRDVDFSQTVDLLQRLRAQNGHVEELIFPDEIHGFLMWKSWIRAMARRRSFLGENWGEVGWRRSPNAASAAKSRVQTLALTAALKRCATQMHCTTQIQDITNCRLQVLS